MTNTRGVIMPMLMLSSPAACYEGALWGAEDSSPGTLNPPPSSSCNVTAIKTLTQFVCTLSPDSMVKWSSLGIKQPETFPTYAVLHPMSVADHAVHFASRLTFFSMPRHSQCTPVFIPAAHTAFLLPSPLPLTIVTFPCTFSAWSMTKRRGTRWIL